MADPQTPPNETPPAPNPAPQPQPAPAAPVPAAPVPVPGVQAPALPPMAVRVVNGKTEREIALERERDDAVARQKKAELDAQGLLDENQKLKNPAKLKRDRSELDKYLFGEDED